LVEIVKRGGANRVVLEIYRNCGEALGVPDEGPPPEILQKIAGFKDALRQAGREMVTTGQVCRETVDRLHIELMSDDEYMAEANRQWDEMIGQSR
ncbi:MAG: flavodoxin family protein, partial [Dehalococcoidia bacterium]